MAGSDRGVGGVLLAAGTSSRFGDDPPKQLAPFEGVPLVRRAAVAALAAGLAPVTVVVGHRSDEVEAALAGLAVSIVDNPRFAEGQASSVRAAVAVLPTGLRAVLFLPCDQPLLDAPALIRMVEAYGEAGSKAIAVAVAAGRRGAPVLFDRSYLAELAAIRGDEGGRQLLRRHPERIVEVELAERALADVDTAEDLARLGASSPGLALPAFAAPASDILSFSRRGAHIVSENRNDSPESPTAAQDFIRAMVERDLASGKHGGRVATRFPPEPNGYLHIGHAKSICLNFGLAEQYGGTCNLRFDDTNPETEDPEYVAAIEDDVRWLGFDWGERRFFASDYFEILYGHAVHLIETGKAYVDSLSEEEIRDYRGTVTEPGRNSPYRERSIEENLDLFRRMRAGEFADGEHVLRAKIDMAAANMKMRDPLLYRIKHASHYRTGDDWCLYPLYDFTHCLSDAQEGITHSLCTLEFENNREIYDWVLDHTVNEYRPEQTEFARLNLSYTVLSKRKLLELVETGAVFGWDDPRMPTLRGYRRRGYTPESIRAFCDRIGVAKANSVVDVALLEHSIRDDLNPQVPRVLCVLRPLKVVIENYPEGESEELDAPYYPHDVPKEGSRALPFSRELWIERDDFAEDPPKGFYRLAPDREVRLRYAYFIRCTEVIKDDAGEVIELRCTYDPETRGGSAPDGRKVKGTIHWVSAAHAAEVEVRLYDRLFSVENPSPAKGGPDFKQFLNPSSLEVIERAFAEPSLAGAEPGSRCQFERLGYFYLDPDAGSESGRSVFNRIVPLRDTWAKAQQAAGREEAAAAREEIERAKAETAAKQRSSEEGERPAPAARSRSAAQQARAERYRSELGLGEEEARILTDDDAVADLFDEALRRHGNATAVANWLVNDLMAVLKERTLGELPLTGEALGELVALVDDGTISSAGAKQVFAELVERGGSPAAIVEAKGLRQVRDEGELAELVDRVLAEHPDELAAYRAGKSQLRGFFVGQAMRASGGKADPQKLQRLLGEKLGG